jgi:glyoxylase-like metal-dependent hydrolase (beta-lactamase superfamily II)
VAGQVTGLTQNLHNIRLAAPAVSNLEGYAITDNRLMPVVGDANRIYDTYIEQLVAGAKAAVTTDLFEIQNVVAGVYCALARPQVLTNCDAAIFVNSADVLVVDAHAKPSAAVALIAQIKKHITSKPVRYLVDTHFHWDHSQGNAGYREAFGKDLKIIVSDATKELEAQFLQARLRESFDPHGQPFAG